MEWLLNSPIVGSTDTAIYYQRYQTFLWPFCGQTFLWPWPIQNWDSMGLIMQLPYTEFLKFMGYIELHVHA